MSNAKSASNVLICAVLAVLLMVVFVPVSAQASAYTPHGAINIIGDGQLTLEHGVLSGSGTSSDPFIIAAWEIGVGSGGAVLTGISIKNTVKHVEIRSVHVSHCNIGIYMLNVTNIDIKNCFIDNNSIGISIAHSDDCSVTSNTISDNQFGVTIRESSIPVKDNIFANNEINVSVNNRYVPWELSSLGDKICFALIIVLLFVLVMLLYFRYTSKKEREKNQPPMMQS